MLRSVSFCDFKSENAPDAEDVDTSQQPTCEKDMIFLRPNGVVVCSAARSRKVIREIQSLDSPEVSRSQSESRVDPASDWTT